MGMSAYVKLPKDKNGVEYFENFGLTQGDEITNLGFSHTHKNLEFFRCETNKGNTVILEK